MNIPDKTKPVGCLAKDRARPSLGSAAIVQTDDGLELHATDTYMAVCLPVLAAPVEDTVAPGPVSREALTAIQKNHGQFDADADTITVDGVVYRRVDVGQFPRLAQVWPNADVPIVFEIGLDADKLAKLAAAMGGAQVVLSFIDPLRPVQVRPLEGSGRGIIMPIRVKG